MGRLKEHTDLKEREKERKKERNKISLSRTLIFILNVLSLKIRTSLTGYLGGLVP